MAVGALFSRNFKSMSYFILLSFLALLLYYGAWKIASSDIILNKLGAVYSCKTIATDAPCDTFAADTAATQTARRKVMEDYCLTHSYEREPTVSRESLGYIIVDEDHKIIYCTIPKVSTTTWKNVLAKLRGIKVKDEKSVHQWDLWNRLYQYNEKERAIRLQTYFKFLFVREPLKRLLSAYKDKFIGQDMQLSRFYRRNIVKAYRPQDLDKNDNLVNFAEFIKYYSDDFPRNQHWRQYEKLCHPCLVNYTFIGHLETMAEDAPLLLEMAGIDDRVSFPPIHKSTNTTEILEYYSQVPVEYIKRLGELYRSDFEMFGYEYLGPVKPLLQHNLSEKGYSNG